ncbi:MAG: hypothetical protein HQ581_11365 [Planctomycetes bacterium]|nr:hypothetical protein [Planctomycetota bacterium]
MIRITPLFVLTSLLFAEPLPAEAVRPSAVVVCSADAGLQEELAAREIRRYVYLRTGELLPIAPTAKGNAIIVARRDRPIVESFSLGELGPQQYELKTISQGDRRVVLVVGGDDIGTLYGAYRFLETLGVRFYLHQDVIPDEQIVLELPDVNETGKPLFDMRGLNSWGAHVEGIDLWDADEYKAVFTQMAKMRMNAMSIHSYPQKGGSEPAVWVGLPQDVDDRGRVSFSPTAGYWTTGRTTWGYDPRKTGAYRFGGSLLFETDDWGAPVMAEHIPWPNTLQQRNEVFNNMGELFREAFTFARALGIKTALGTEGGIKNPGTALQTNPGDRGDGYGPRLSLSEHGPPIMVGPELEARMKALGKNPKDPAAIQELYEGIFKRIANTHPLDYYVIYTIESWYWASFNQTMFDAMVEEWNLALAAWEKVKPPFGLATGGWVLGPDFDHAAFDKALPKHVAIGEMSRAYNAPVDEAFARIEGRPKWSVPWIEEDSPILTPQLWAGRVRKDAADALAYGCTGLMVLHWRTLINEQAATAVARAGWDQSGWNPEFGKENPQPPASTFPVPPLPLAGRVSDIGTDRPIANTEHPRLYQTCRWDFPGYDWEVPNGRYRVTLRFCEPYFTAAGQRIFDVTLQGKTVIEKLDLFAEAGKDIAWDRSFDGVEVTGGRFRLGLVPRVSLPCIMAVEIQGDGYIRKVNCGAVKYEGYEPDEPGYRPTKKFLWGEGGSSSRPQDGTSFRPRGLPVDDLYADWALANFGPEVAREAAAVFVGIDNNIPLPATWTGVKGKGAGGLAPDLRPWDFVSREYAFVDEFAKLRPAVRGAGNRERFDFWCNQLLYTRATAKACCVWGQFAAALKVAREEKDPAKRKALAAERVLPLYVELVHCVGEAYELLMATVTDIGGIQTVINWEGHNGLLGIETTGRELTEMLGQPLPPTAAIPTQYQGRPRLIVPTVRSLLEQGEALKLKVIVLDNRRPGSPGLSADPTRRSSDPIRQAGRLLLPCRSLSGPRWGSTFRPSFRRETRRSHRWEPAKPCGCGARKRIRWRTIRVRFPACRRPSRLFGNGGWTNRSIRGAAGSPFSPQAHSAKESSVS